MTHHHCTLTLIYLFVQDWDKMAVTLISMIPQFPGILLQVFIKGLADTGQTQFAWLLSES